MPKFNLTVEVKNVDAKRVKKIARAFWRNIEPLLYAYAVQHIVVSPQMCQSGSSAYHYYLRAPTIAEPALVVSGQMKTAPNRQLPDFVHL